MSRAVDTDLPVRYFSVKDESGIAYADVLLDTLRDVLFAYYCTGNVRNKISHAESEAMEDKNTEGSDRGENSALTLMMETVDLFISSYEKAMSEVQDKNPNIIIITGEDVREIAESMREERGHYDNRRHRDHNN